MKKITFNEQYGLHDSVLCGRKTMTRRVVSQRFLYNANLIQIKGLLTLKDYLLVHAPYQIDDVVAIAQRYNETQKESINQDAFEKGCNNKMFVRAELMPHHIRITDVKIEHLQDIGDEDCFKEGVYEDYEEHGGIYTTEFYDYIGNKGDGFGTPFEAFASLIDAISGKGTWKRNPLVYVYEFELID